MLYKNIEIINENTIKTLIKKSSTQHNKIKKLYERYKGTEEGVPILTRKYKIDNKEQKDKINNKEANDFFSEIIDLKVGFFCSIPVVYELDKTNYMTAKIEEVPETDIMGEEKEPEMVVNSKYDTDMEFINNWKEYNQVADLDLETTKFMSICGYAGREFYVGLETNEPVVKMELHNPWELIFIGKSIEDADYCIRYYDIIKYNEQGEEKIESIAILFSDSDIKTYVLEREKTKEGELNDSKYRLIDEKPHSFNRMPVIGFANNNEMLGDADKVLSLIDGYDRTMSDVDSELEQFRLAYLAIVGASVTPEILDKLKQTGALSLPPDADAKFVVKNLDDAIIEHHLDRLEKNIYRFSRTPNFNDISFGGNLTGVAMKYKFMPFENKCVVAELKFEKASNQQFKLLTGIWNEKGASINYLDIKEQFTRNYPQNLPEEVQMLRDSKGIVSEKTRFSLVSFIDDPEEEMEALKMEETENMENFLMRNEMMSQQASNEEDNFRADQQAVKNKAE